MCDRPYYYHRQTVQLLSQDTDIPTDPRLTQATTAVLAGTGVQLTSRGEAIVFGSPVALYGINVKKVMCLSLDEMNQLHAWLGLNAHERRYFATPHVVKTWGMAAAQRCLSTLLPSVDRVASSIDGYADQVVLEPVEGVHIMYVLYNPAVLLASVGLPFV